MQYICDKRGVPFYYDLMKGFVNEKLARDLQHCGTDAHEILANKFFNIIQGNNK
jgi:hypothetical protein